MLDKRSLVESSRVRLASSKPRSPGSCRDGSGSLLKRFLLLLSDIIFKQLKKFYAINCFTFFLSSFLFLKACFQTAALLHFHLQRRFKKIQVFSKTPPDSTWKLTWTGLDTTEYDPPPFTVHAYSMPAMPLPFRSTKVRNQNH